MVIRQFPHLRSQESLPTPLLSTPVLIEAANNLGAITGVEPNCLEELARLTELSSEQKHGDVVDVVDNGKVLTVVFGSAMEFGNGAGRGLQTRDVLFPATDSSYRLHRLGPQVDVRHSRMSAVNKIMTWADVKRGRDVFLAGLPTFHIGEAVDAILEARRTFVPTWLTSKDSANAINVLRTLECLKLTAEQLRRDHDIMVRKIELGEDRGFGATTDNQADPILILQQSSQLPLWVFSTHEIRSYGHFPALRQNPEALRRVHNILESGHESPPCKHLVRFATFWGDVDHVDVLDELEAAADWYRAWRHNSSPETSRRWSEGWPDGGEAMPPQMLLNCMRELERQRQLGPDVRYQHLDGLADPIPEPNGEQKLRVLRSKHDVARAAKELRNCALSYADRVQAGQYVLVAMVSSTGCAEALAGFQRTAGNREHSQTWNHRPVEKNNRPASESMLNLFNSYLPALSDWANQAVPVETGNVPANFRAQNLQKVCGIGRATSAALRRAGITDIPALAALANDRERHLEVLEALKTSNFRSTNPVSDIELQSLVREAIGFGME